MAKQCPEPGSRELVELVEGLVWIYILLMRNNMLYVGQTKDVEKRIQRHADGSGSGQASNRKIDPLRPKLVSANEACPGVMQWLVRA
jgi:hypothetical protein